MCEANAGIACSTLDDCASGLDPGPGSERREELHGDR